MITSYSEFILDISINNPELYEKQKSLHFHLQNTLNMSENLAERLSIFLLRETKLPNNLMQVNDEYIKSILDNGKFVFALDNQLITDVESWYYMQPKFYITPLEHPNECSSITQELGALEVSSVFESIEHYGIFAPITTFDANKNMDNNDYDIDADQTYLLEENNYQAIIDDIEMYDHIPLKIMNNQWWELEDKDFKL